MRSTSSPAAWPWASFTALKRSRSIITSASPGTAGVERPVERATVRQTGERIGLGLDVQPIAVAQALEDRTGLGGDQLHHLGRRVVEVRLGTEATVTTIAPSRCCRRGAGRR